MLHWTMTCANPFGGTQRLSDVALRGLRSVLRRVPKHQPAEKRTRKRTPGAMGRPCIDALPWQPKRLPVRHQKEVIWRTEVSSSSQNSQPLLALTLQNLRLQRTAGPGNVLASRDRLARQ